MLQQFLECHMGYTHGVRGGAGSGTLRVKDQKTVEEFRPMVDHVLL